MAKSTNFWILGIAIVGVGLYFTFRHRLSRFKRQVVFQANKEAEKWANYSETDPATIDIMQQYWCEGVNQCNFTDSQIVSDEFQDVWAWSAAFISWIMESAGAGEEFPYHQTHAHYTIKTTENRHNDDGAKFKAYSSDETKPELSDVIISNRGTTNASYGNVQAGDKLHGDIVVAVRDNEIDVVGGNVGNKVKKTTIALDEDGFVANPDTFAIIKNTM